MMSLRKKVILGTAVGLISGLSFAQTLQEGIANLDSDKYAKAKQIFTDMIAKSPTAENYFYLGNAYLSQFEPNYAKAYDAFSKGLSIDSKNYLSKIGMASIKLGKGDKNAIAEIQSIVSDSREKNPEVLFRAAEALTLFEKVNAPDIAIDYLNKAVEKSEKTGVPAYYYYRLGDAYRLKRLPGDAMTAYDKALAVAQNKASVFSRMGTLWMAAQQWKLAKEKIDAAIMADPTYAPAYKAKASYDIKYQLNAQVTQDLLNYSKYADEDPNTQLEIAKLYFINDDFANSKVTLDKIFDQIEDPVKYKLRAYLYYTDANYADAKTNLNKFISTVDKTRVQPADYGFQGLITAGLAQQEKDEAQKAAMLAEAQKNVAIAKAAKDETMNWDVEMTKLQTGSNYTQAEIDAGPTNATIDGLKKQIATNPKDADALVKLGIAYQEAQNYKGAVATWDKMIALAPTWEYSFYAKGSAYQQLGNNDAAEASYQKYINTLVAKTPEEQARSKETLAYAYFLVAYFNQTKDVEKAKDYASKSVMLNPAYEDAATLNKKLNK